MAMARIVIDKTKCSLCYLCVRLCPSAVFRIDNSAIAVNESQCILCYGCIRICPKRAISINASGYKILDYVRY